ncbi:MAG: endopeptidase La [Deltaproteobacteria bacterium]|nr:endopeptidase La [Deltaproteobacteria bacterium]
MNAETKSESAIWIPHELPILPLRNTVAYPYSILPLMVGVSRSVRLVEDSVKREGIIGLVASRDGSVEEPQPGQTYEVGTAVKIERVTKGAGSSLEVVVRGLERFRIEYWQATDPFLKASVLLAPDAVEEGVELDALVRSLREVAKEVFSLSTELPKEVGIFLDQVKDPRYLVYLLAGSAGLGVEKGQKLLEQSGLKDKLHTLISHFSQEKEILVLGKKIQTEAKGEMDKAQRDYYLRQQMKAIRKELGDTDETESVGEVYAEKIEEAALPEEAKKEALRELKRLKGMSPQSPEYPVIKTYLDWILDLPWNTVSEDQVDIDGARRVLDEDHYDLEEVKERIIEYLAVRKLLKERTGETVKEKSFDMPEGMGAILCFAGPPGVGKTSLGQSIARALGRRFTRMSLGGIRDEAEIRGHRRTYIGAMPGRIIQAIKRAGTKNPVFMLDEVDKIGMDWRGDPGSALLEVLDPAQNHAFRDHYLDVDFDLSDVMFITTANQLETIPPALRDRMETIRLDGYTEYEKVHIACRYLVPRQLKVNGLRENEITFTDEALRKIVQDYTREAGVRNLERLIGAVCRKSAVKIAGGERSFLTVTPETVRVYLKKERFEAECSECIEIPGIATGLAVTAVGGDILFIEATRMKGKGNLTLTGQLGDVMRESAQIAHSYVRSKAGPLGFEPGLFEDTDVHVHVPAGAIPKDGPSAGLAMVMAVASLFSDRPVRGDIGMTGEVTLRGRVLPVGGIKMKLLAAHRAGLKTVILPKRNERDLDELPKEVREQLKIVLVERIDEALGIALSEETCENIAMAANG